jgi:hypothetical protein
LYFDPESSRNLKILCMEIAKNMNEKMTCLCMGCGKAYLLGMPDLDIEFLEDFDRRRIKNHPCPECNCELILIDDPDTDG